MKISVPVIANVDFLLLGGAVEGCRKAVELAKKGYSVFAATPYSHFGEDICSTLELLDSGRKTPAQVKHELDLAFIESGADFLFQSSAAALTLDEKGNVAGAVIANRTGFQAINAKCILDATQFGMAAQYYCNGENNFIPGEYEVSLIQIGACKTSGGITLEQLPDVVEDGISYPVFRAIKRMNFTEFSPESLNKGMITMRRACFHPDMVRCADQCVYHFGNVCKPVDPESGILTKENFTFAETLIQKRPARKASRVKTFSSSGKNYEVVRLDKPIRFNDDSFPTIAFDLNALPVLASCDVLVTGAGTAGAPAAIAAARSGAETIVTESMAYPGGICTSGMICTYWFGNRCGFTRELDKCSNEMGPNPVTDILHGNTYNPIWKQQWLMQEIDDAGGKQFYFTFCVGAVIQGNQVCGSLCAGPFGCGIILAKRCVDATGNADLAAAAGGAVMPFIPEEPAVQGAGLAPFPLKPHTEGSDENSDYSFVCDSDVADGSRFFVMARGKFNDCFDVTNILDTRERRRIDGDIHLQPQDIYANRTYSDTITIARSNFDTHGFTVHPMFLIKASEKEPYYAKVPFRALLPKNLEHILVTGLAVSAHRDCMPLIRMQPDLQNQGYAAGLAAAMTAADELPMRKIDIRKLQKKLVGKEILPESILQENDAVCRNSGDGSHSFLSLIFLDEQNAIPNLKKMFSADPENIQYALILAYLGDDSGKNLLKRTVESMEWDQGWNYRGMGQFGASCSPLDSMIMALDRINDGADIIFKKLQTISVQSEFSHIRAVCMYFIHHPQPAAAKELRRLLSSSGMSGHAIKNYSDALASNRKDRDDTSVRNLQLKEIYLAKALCKCDSLDTFGRSVLDSYRTSMQGYYSLFAKV